MKYIIILFVGIMLLIAILWQAIGGQLLAVLLGATFLVLALLSAVALGSWWSARLMREGANIALVAQASDDKRDLGQTSALADLVRETLRIKNEQPQINIPEYPVLPNNSQLIDAEFSISGFDEEKQSDL